MSLSGSQLPPPTLRAGAESGDSVWQRRPDPRLPAYLVAGFGALILAMVTGEREIAALGAPFLALAAIGLARREPTALRGSVSLNQTTTVEGDVVEGTVSVDWDGPAEVEVILAGWRGVTPLDPIPAIGWSLPLGEGPVTLPFQLQARSWGVHSLGAVWARARRPGSFAVREQKVAAAPILRIFPSTVRISRLLKPAEPRTVAGMHLARVRGHGTDFAELRPYQPGDRLRDLSWCTSARLGKPWVRVNHPERTGTVLILLDAVFSEEEQTKEALARAARAAWAVASVHLKAQDRVGLLARGRTAGWLPPRGGPRARWMLMEELLGVGRAAEDPLARKRARRRIQVPADALIVGVTNLRSQVFAPDLLHFRRVGHTTVALVIDTSDLLPGGENQADTLARRIWLAQRDSEQRSLERGGVPTALVTGDAGAAPAILTLRRRLDASRNRSWGWVHAEGVRVQEAPS
ncbi:MAG: DUF58 domain-containing protein [Gemmatimonadota bacterium]